MLLRGVLAGLCTSPWLSGSSPGFSRFGSFYQVFVLGFGLSFPPLFCASVSCSVTQLLIGGVVLFFFFWVLSLGLFRVIKLLFLFNLSYVSAYKQAIRPGFFLAP